MTKELIPNHLPLEVVAETVAAHLGLTQEQLFQRTNKRFIVEKRSMFWSLARRFSNNHTLTTIANYCTRYSIPSFNHATVTHGSKIAGILYEMDKDYKITYDKLKLELELQQESPDPLINLKKEVIKKVSFAYNKEEILSILRNIE